MDRLTSRSDVGRGVTLEDTANSAWLGGDGEAWERGPYWLDGIVPLAYLLDDTQLKVKVKHWMDYIISHQQEDGWLGPVEDNEFG